MTSSDSYIYMIVAIARNRQNSLKRKNRFNMRMIYFSYFFYLHNCCYYKEKYIQPFADIFYFHY